MVKKLFKHEFLAYMRALLPMHLIMLGIAALTRFVYIFEDTSNLFNIVGTSSIVAFCVSCVVCLVLSGVNIITRFYKNMFTHEGYLSFTLPVTVEQHIFVKMVTGIAVILANVMFIIVGVCVATAGELTVELFKAGFWILDIAAEEIGWHYWLFLIELFIIAIVSIAAEILLFYSCIAIGQLSNKNRIILAIGVYFIYYFITQVISTVLIAVMSIIGTQEWFASMMDAISMFSDTYPNAFVHMLLWSVIVFVGLLGLLYYFITKKIMKSKLNLE